MFRFERDYIHWICLKTEDRDTIGMLEKEWNDFDHFTPATKTLHTTKRKTQPWKTWLPVDWRPKESSRTFPPLGWFMRPAVSCSAKRMALNHVRHDAFEVLERTPDLLPAPQHPLSAASRQAGRQAGSLSCPPKGDIPKVTDLFGKPNKSVTFGA